MKKIFVISTMKRATFCFISLLALSFSFLTLSAQTKSKAKLTTTTAAGTPAPAAASYTGPKGCPNAMDDAEFKAVKKTVSDETDMDEVLKVAKKVATTHCYSAEQVKAIMPYLKSDDNRFEFFKAVFPHIYDRNNYNTIGETFKDASYKDKIRVYVNSLE